MDYLINGAKLIIGLVALLVVIRLLGKKQLTQMTPYDVVYLLVFGGILEESLYDEKVSILLFLFSVSVWAIAIYVVEKVVTISNPLRILIKGEADRLINDGQINKRLMDKNQLEMEQLRTMLRKQGIFSLREVRDLFIEPGGDISVNQYAKYKTVVSQDINLENAEEEPTVLLIDEGQIKREVLGLIGKTEAWLYSEMERLGYVNLESILYCEWSKTEDFFIKTYDDTSNSKR
ncbi:DUF421 domain-containing protein [Sporosarcina psychrophila]|uniref:DUF421 domain-containing protein n=1 Tax=Sporosarcina psychrophila TaxID=1476 RepID=UPI00078D8C89|nr:YetF domain-containing protein [Sporosarcina psychrophila]AMQ04997.1 hypothetical protein AZE41_02925 [Sporosarcina psychrophila]